MLPNRMLECLGEIQYMCSKGNCRTTQGRDIKGRLRFVLRPGDRWFVHVFTNAKDPKCYQIELTIKNLLPLSHRNFDLNVKNSCLDFSINVGKRCKSITLNAKSEGDRAGEIVKLMGKILSAFSVKKLPDIEPDIWEDMTEVYTPPETEKNVKSINSETKMVPELNGDSNVTDDYASAGKYKGTPLTNGGRSRSLDKSATSIPLKRFSESPNNTSIRVFHDASPEKRQKCSSESPPRVAKSFSSLRVFNDENVPEKCTNASGSKWTQKSLSVAKELQANPEIRRVFTPSAVDNSSKSQSTQPRQYGDKANTGPPKSKLKLYFASRHSLPNDYRSTLNSGSSTAGYDNLGNTCYMNAVLQALRHIEPFQDMCKEHSKGQNETPVLRLLLDLFNSTGGYRTLLRKINWCMVAKDKKFAAVKQNDPHEFMIIILGLLRKEMNMGATNTLFPFHWKIVNEYTCPSETCKKRWESPDDPVDAMISIGQTDAMLQHLVHNYSMPLPIKDVKCAECSRVNLTIRTFRILEHPQILWVVLLRFNDKGEKLTEAVSFSEKLDFNGQEYKLLSAVVHRGSSINSGHYTCYIREVVNGTNHYKIFDDSSVRDIDERSFFADPQKHWYMCFYSKAK